MLVLVATEVVEACRSLGVVAWDSTRTQAGSATQLLDEAWTRSFADSAAFGAWEANSLAEL